MKSIAGTKEFDTAADCSKVTPLDYKGKLTLWYQGVFEGDPDILRQNYKEFFEAFRKTYPNIDLEEQGITYNDLLDKFRTALLGNAAPMVVRLQILGGTEFAAKGYLEPLKPEDVGYSSRRLLARRDEGGDLGRRDLRHPDQQRDDGLHLERRHLQARRPRPRQGAGHLGRRRRLLQADPRQARHRRLRPRRPQERRQHALPLHAAALGLRRRRLRRGVGQPDLQGGRARQPAEQGGAAGLLRHVRARQVGAGLGTHQPAGRQPGAVPRRPARDDDLASVRLHRDAGPAEEDDGRRHREGADRHRQHALRPDPDRAGRQARRGVRRLQHPHPEARVRRRRQGGRAGGQGAHLHVDEPRMVAEARLGRLQPGQPRRLPHRLDEGASRDDQVPRRDDLDAALRHPVPGAAGVARDHEHHRPRHAAERPDRCDDRRRRRPTTPPRRSRT